VEIVSAPDLRSAAQARAYVRELRAILVATGASDGKMEEGSLRVDANVSVRRAGSPDLGTRCEIKNMNSLSSLGRAVDYEADRQRRLLESGDEVVQETRHWNEAEGRTLSMRSKEEAYDYRYFPEPDLVPVAPEDDWQAKVIASMPVLPAQRRDLLAAAAHARGADAALLVELDLDALVLRAIELGADPRVALNRAANEVAADLDAARGLDPAGFAALVRMEAAGELTATQAKDVLAEMLASGGAPAAIAEAKGYEALSSEALGAAVDSVIAANGALCERFRAGDAKVLGALVGQVMKATQGRADGKLATALLTERLQPDG
ncbi:MAG TPA: Asp-tRNA(Asn)/Glu-tRNA(Gln) amidotransferase subunit GatB, partial [Acidimicrobiales bacterium]|nr:Asp-tRNA(Asn)/Glu-tRNA(Gln) amidotransferase subunit GatB [Acidimicrobiales bacterium]